MIKQKVAKKIIILDYEEIKINELEKLYNDGYEINIDGDDKYISIINHY